MMADKKHWLRLLAYVSGALALGEAPESPNSNRRRRSTGQSRVGNRRRSAAGTPWRESSRTTIRGQPVLRRCLVACEIPHHGKTITIRAYFCCEMDDF